MSPLDRTHTLDRRSVKRRYLTMLALRWLPVGLMIPIFVLLPLERGLSLAEVGLVYSMQGFVVMALELPTGGLSDALGRRPVLLLAAGVALVAGIVFYGAHTVAMFALAAALQGVFRALDSGPLESWYVDSTLAADPGARIEDGLSAGGVVLGVAIAAGALLSGLLVAWAPIAAIETLALPVLVAFGINILGLAVLAVLLTETRPAGGGVEAVTTAVRAVPGVIGSSVRLLRGSRVLMALVAVELLWGFGSVAFETLMPVRLSAVLGSADQAAAIMGPVGSAAWAAAAGGAALAMLVSRRIGVPATAALMRILQGATVVAMGLLAGPVGVVTAFLACYTIHGASNPMHTTLLHQQVDGSNRTTVLSLNSMVAQPAGAIGLIALAALADATSVSTAMVVGGVVLALAAPLYLPAWRASRKDRGRPETASQEAEEAEELASAA